MLPSQQRYFTFHDYFKSSFLGILPCYSSNFASSKMPNLLKFNMNDLLASFDKGFQLNQPCVKDALYRVMKLLIG